jgi:cytidine deaminase
MPSEISESDLSRLVAAARDASQNAYCPYSRFPVGAAVLSTTGEIVTGCNVENASYGLTLCAERNAVFAAVAQGIRALTAVAIFTPTPSPTAPCGACRQVLNEFGPDIVVVSACTGSQRRRWTLSDILPAAFGPKSLGS